MQYLKRNSNDSYIQGWYNFGVKEEFWLISKKEKVLCGMFKHNEMHGAWSKQLADLGEEQREENELPKDLVRY